MATWVEPIESETDPDAPLTSGLAKRWDNNVIAAFEGATDAPRINGNAGAIVADWVAGGRYGGISVTAADTYGIEAGLSVVDGTLSTLSTSYVVAYTITNLSFTGSIRFKATHSAPPTGADASYLRLTLNGVQLGEWLADAIATQSIDVSVSPADIVAWEHRSSGGSESSIVAGRGQSGSEALIPIAPLGLASLA
jgi:hypothetical protein